MGANKRERRAGVTREALPCHCMLGFLTNKGMLLVTQEHHIWSVDPTDRGHTEETLRLDGAGKATGAFRGSEAKKRRLCLKKKMKNLVRKE